MRHHGLSQRAQHAQQAQQEARWAGEDSVASLAADVAALLGQLGGSCPPAAPLVPDMLLGHSMGVKVALCLLRLLVKQHERGGKGAAGLFEVL